MYDEHNHPEGFKPCSICKEWKSPEEFYKQKRRGGLSYACRVCHRKNIKENKRTAGTYAFKYRRYERVMRSARKRGIDFSLTVDEFWKIKSAEQCHYCKEPTDDITIDRVDNDKGYHADNIVGACYLCNKTKSALPFSLEEMLEIGTAIRKMKQRTGMTGAQVWNSPSKTKTAL